MQQYILYIHKYITNFLYIYVRKLITEER